MRLTSAGFPTKAPTNPEIPDEYTFSKNVRSPTSIILNNNSYVFV